MEGEHVFQELEHLSLLRGVGGQLLPQRQHLRMLIARVCAVVCQRQREGGRAGGRENTDRCQTEDTRTMHHKSGWRKSTHVQPRAGEE